VSGRKRHLLVDTEGLLLRVVVSAADVQDRDGGYLVLHALRLYGPDLPRLRHLWVDAAYRGTFVAWVEQQRGWHVEVVGRLAGTTGFVVQPRRWVVERTFAWLGRFRRLSKDYEYRVESSEALIYLAMTRHMLRRLARLRLLPVVA
jgi:putative transposase